jgi:hypothetical protein
MKKNLLFLILIGGLFAACDPKKNTAVTIVYRPLVTFTSFSEGPTYDTIPDEDTVIHLPPIDRSPNLPGTQYTLYKLEEIINEGSNSSPFDFVPGQIYLSYDYNGRKHVSSYNRSTDKVYTSIKENLISPITSIPVNAGKIKKFPSGNQPSPYFLIKYSGPVVGDSINEASISTRELAGRYTYRTFYPEQKDRYIIVLPKNGIQLVPYHKLVTRDQLIKIMNAN